MKITIDIHEAILEKMGQYLKAHEQMPLAGTDKDILVAREECRSLAAEITFKLLLTNPELEAQAAASMEKYEPSKPSARPNKAKRSGH